MTSRNAEHGTFTQTSELEFVMTRVFQAPRELVYAACTEPRHMTNWWGPRGYTLSVCEMDVRPGGAWRFVQDAPDGSTYGFHGTFHEVVPPERIVMTQIFDPFPMSELLVTQVFEELGNDRTRLTSTMRFDSIEARDGSMGAGMEAGFHESLDRLAELLASLQRAG